MPFKTFTPRVTSKADRKWYIIDAKGQILGRLATNIAVILRGKNKSSFVPFIDMGDYVVVINAAQVKVTGNKEEQKEYIHHTGYWGHLRRKTLKTVRQETPTKILEQAVAGMIPRNRIKKHVLSKLFIYPGQEHPHSGQKPTLLKF